MPNGKSEKLLIDPRDIMGEGGPEDRSKQAKPPDTSDQILIRPEELSIPEVPEADTGSILGGAWQEIKDVGESFAPPRSLREAAIRTLDPTGLIGAAAAHLGTIGRTAGEVAGDIRHPIDRPTSLPLLGLHVAESEYPVVGEMAHRLEQRPLRETIGRGAVDAAMLLAMRGRGEPDVPGALGRIQKSLDFPAGKLGIKFAEGRRAIQASKADMAEIARETPIQGKGSAAFRSFVDAIKQKQKDLWRETHKPQIERWENEVQKPEDAISVYTEATKTLPSELTDASPAETAKARAWAEKLKTPRTLGQLDDFLRDLNRDIEEKPYERYGSKELRVRQEAATAIRADIDRILEEQGEPGVRDYNRRWGALNTLKERAQVRAIEEFRKEAKAGPIPDWIHTYAFLHPGISTVPAAVGFGLRLGRLLTPEPGARLARGLRTLGRSELRPPPAPPFRLTGERDLPLSSQVSLPLRPRPTGKSFRSPRSNRIQQVFISPP